MEGRGVFSPAVFFVTPVRSIVLPPSLPRQKNYSRGSTVHRHSLVLLGNVIETVDARPRNRASKNSVVIFFNNEQSAQNHGNLRSSSRSSRISIRLRNKFYRSDVLARALCKKLLFRAGLCGVSRSMGVRRTLRFLRPTVLRKNCGCSEK